MYIIIDISLGFAKFAQSGYKEPDSPNLRTLEFKKPK